MTSVISDDVGQQQEVDRVGQILYDSSMGRGEGNCSSEDSNCVTSVTSSVISEDVAGPLEHHVVDWGDDDEEAA